jgi:hypothetical protein
MKLETINIILAISVVILLGYIAFTAKHTKPSEYYRYRKTDECRAALNELADYNRMYNPVFQSPEITSKAKNACGDDYIIGQDKELQLTADWTHILGGTHNANITDIFNDKKY